VIARARPYHDPGIYPERDSRRDAALDRVLASAGFWIGQVFARELPEPRELANRVHEHAQRFAGASPDARVAEVRYRLRRDGFAGERLDECLGLCCAAIGGSAPVAISPAVLGAAALMVNGFVVESGSEAERMQALALASMAFAIEGTPVHAVTASEARARRLAGMLAAPLAALGCTAGFVSQSMGARERRQAYGASVVCGPQRVLAMDYLRDRLLLGRRLGPVKGRLERLASSAQLGSQAMLPGLHCALVDDADNVLLDDSRAPLVISADADQARQRLLYDQALEIARALAEGADFAIGAEGAEFTPAGAERLSRLVLPLGGAWLARPRREALVGAALDALHVLQRDRDYRVVQGRLVIPEPEGELAEDEEEQDQVLRGMLEVKEGCKLSGAQDVLTRLSAARFFGRYRHLAGACADARGLEREFWSLYSLRTRRCGPVQAAAAACGARVFLSTAARRAALVESARTLLESGSTIVLALRTQEEAQAVAPRLAGIAPCERLRINVHPAQRELDQAPPGDTHLLVGELHEAARHVAQLRRAFAARRCGQFLALEDPGVAAAAGAVACAMARLRASAQGELPGALAQWLAARAQRGMERAQATLRLAAAQRERSLEDLLAFSGQPE
jgi:preprotein translocase subunit SecA